MHYLYSGHEDSILKGSGLKFRKNSELDSKQSANPRFWCMTVSVMTACNKFSTAVEYDGSKRSPHILLGILRNWTQSYLKYNQRLSVSINQDIGLG